jgi:hypothetical protein
MSCVMSPADPNRRWTKGNMPYVFDAIHFGGGRNQSLRDRVNLCVNVWNGYGIPVRFVERTWEPNFIVFTMNPVPPLGGNDVASSSASRARGMCGGPQLIYLSAGVHRHSILHEMGHAAGLAHEHIREDRDEHIRINWQNINPIHVDQFFKHAVMTDDVGPYDYASIMHYRPEAYSLEGNPTFDLLDNAPLTGPDANDLSAGDLDGLRFLYKEFDFATITFPAALAFTYPVTIDPPAITVDVPSMSVTPPKVRVSPPKVKVGGRSYSVPAFDAQPPTFTVSPPRLTVMPAPIALNQPPLMVTPPSMRVPRNRPPKSVSLQPKTMVVQPPAVTVAPPPFTVVPPAVRIKPPSFKVTPGSFKVGPIKVHPPELTVDPPEMVVSPPSVTVDPPPVTVSPGPITFVPPPFLITI